MDSKKLEILMTAVDLGSLSKAAEVVGYTQSGLTHLVDSLEREIGMTLVQRDHSGIALTEEGKALMPAIRAAGKPDLRDHGKIGADHPRRGLRQYRHALDAGDPLPVPARLPTYRR